MKKSLLLIFSMISGGFLFADSVKIKNNLRVEICFTMDLPDGKKQGLFCVQPGEVKFADAVEYLGITVYSPLTGRSAFISSEVQGDFRDRYYYNHLLAVESCQRGCGDKNFQVIKISREEMEGKRRKQTRGGSFF